MHSEWGDQTVKDKPTVHVVSCSPCSLPDSWPWGAVRDLRAETQQGPCCGGRKNSHLEWKVGHSPGQSLSSVPSWAAGERLGLPSRLVLLIWQ